MSGVEGPMMPSSTRGSTASKRQRAKPGQASSSAPVAGARRCSNRRRVSTQRFETDTEKETEVLQQAIKASIIAADSTIVDEVPEAPVYHPTAAEFLDPMAYIRSIREEASEYGICKIVPPSGWDPPRMFPEDKPDTFPTRLQPVHRLQEGIGFDYGNTYTMSQYKVMADEFYRSHFHCEPGSLPTPEVEERYWKLIQAANQEVVVEYGNDIGSSSFGSGFPVSGDSKYTKHPWNLNNIALLPGSVIRNLDSKVSGVNIPWVYFGMLFSSFCWHAEDLWMYSINYNHMGAPKSWWGVPGDEHKQVEAAMRAQVPTLFREEPDLAMQLVTQILPKTLIACDVSVYHTSQSAGEFVVTFPRAFHAGFNQGFNCTEAVNFATADWFEHGRHAVEQSRKHAKPSVFAPEKLLVECVETDADSHDKEILHRELSLLVQHQRHWREYWSRNGIKSWKELSCNTEHVEFCALCNQYCYLGFVKCSCDTERIICLQHVPHGCACANSEKDAFFRYEIDVLQSLNDSLVPS